MGMLARENIYFNCILALADGVCSLLSLSIGLNIK